MMTMIRYHLPKIAIKRMDTAPLITTPLLLHVLHFSFFKATIWNPQHGQFAGLELETEKCNPMLGAPRPIPHGGYTEAGNCTPGKLSNFCGDRP